MKYLLLVVLLLTGCNNNDNEVQKLRSDLKECKQQQEVYSEQDAKCINNRIYHLGGDIWIESELKCLTKEAVLKVDRDVAEINAQAILGGSHPNVESIREELLLREADK